MKKGTQEKMEQKVKYNKNTIVPELIKQEKAQQGITLVALVITIIIIIILATVTINFAFGDNGLIRQAELARDLTANSTKYEEDSTANLVAYMNEVMGENSEISVPAKTLVQAFNEGEIKVGDYVNYTPEAHASITVGTSETGYTNSNSMSDGTDQTFSQDASTTWRVLGLSEDGQHLLLTSGSPIKKDGDDPYLVLESYIGAGNCVNVLNKISSLYHNSTLAEETRSMTINDIENVLGGITVTYPEEGESETGTVTLNEDISKTNIGHTTPYPNYTYKEGDYKLENPLQSAAVGEKVEGNMYYFSYDYNQYQRLEININQKTYDMLFKDSILDGNYAKSYWIASIGVDANTDTAAFGPGAVYNGILGSGYYHLFFSNGNWRAHGFAVRPVVILKSNITIEQIQVIEDQTEEAWSTTGGNLYGSGNIND